MPVGPLFDAPGMTQPQYEQVRNAVAPGNRAPAGVLYHTAGPTEPRDHCPVPDHGLAGSSS